MKTEKSPWVRRWSSFLQIALMLAAVVPLPKVFAAEPTLQAGFAVRDITPEVPIWLAGYAARRRPADKIDRPLSCQAMALKDGDGKRFVFISLDNCEVSRAFNEPVVKQLEEKYGLKRGEVMIVSSHTHSAPVLENTLETMYQMPEVDRERVRNYSRMLRERLVELVGAALADLKPAEMEHGIGRATFAVNRRTYREEGMSFGENPEGPVDWDVPVLKVKGTNDTVRAVVFGYACHGTSIQGEDFYFVTGDYMSYTRQHIENVYPGAVTMYLTGMGADSNPSPRGSLLDSKRHGLELAGAVIGVLGHPMRPIKGSLKISYDEVELPLEDPPTREQLDKDLRNTDQYIQRRAEAYLQILNKGQTVPAAVRLPLSAVRIGNDLTFVAMGGEVVVDYGKRFKRLFAADHPWPIGYAYEVPCYIPSIRILKEGGYEAQSSLIYYGFYGPFRTKIEPLLTDKMVELVKRVRE